MSRLGLKVSSLYLMSKNEKALIRSITRGNELAFRTIYDQYFYKVSNYAFKLLHCVDDANEVAQDVFIKIWNKRNELDENKSLSALLFRITKFTSIDKIRQKQPYSSVSLNMLGDIAIGYMENNLHEEELNHIYQSILDKLPAKRRQIFIMSRENDLSHKEIAKQLNLSVKTIESHIGLALKQIRIELKNHSEIPLIF